MKTILAITAACLLVGCETGCQSARYPLQPGESIMFESSERAAEFREVSGNDQTNTGRTVEITAPTMIEVVR